MTGNPLKDIKGCLKRIYQKIANDRKCDNDDRKIADDRKCNNSDGKIANDEGPKIAFWHLPKNRRYPELPQDMGKI